MKVLHIVGGLDSGGIENWLQGYFSIFKAKNDSIVMHVLSCDKNKMSLVDGCIFNEENSFKPKSNNIVQRVIALIKLLKKNKYNIVHCHTDLSSAIYFLIVRIFSNATLICHSHTDRRSLEKQATFIRKSYVYMSKYVIDWLSNHKVAVSQAAGNSLYVKNFDVEFCGVDVCDTGISDDLLKKYKNKKIVFHIGRLSTPKNHEFILDLAHSMRSYTDYHFVCIGDGDEKKQILKKFRDYKLSNVTFLGHRNDVHSILLYHRGLVILPSLWEGLPLSLVEAQKCKKYCFASTNVTTEVDMGGVIFLDLDLETWKENILKFNFDTEFNFFDNGKLFSYTSNYNYFIKLYTGKFIK